MNPEDYHLSQLLVLKLRLDESKSSDPSLISDYDILLTDSLVRLCYHLQFGKVDPESLDPAWNMTRQVRNQNPVGAIEKRLRTGSLARGLKNIRPEIDYYHLLKSVLKKYHEIHEAGGWETIPEGPALKPGMTDQRVFPLRKRLSITGDFDGVVTGSDFFDEELEAAVIRFQKKHRLEADGVVGKNTYAALNIPVGGLQMVAEGFPAVVFRPADDAGPQEVEIYVGQAVNPGFTPFNSSQKTSTADLTGVSPLSTMTLLKRSPQK